MRITAKEYDWCTTHFGKLHHGTKTHVPQSEILDGDIVCLQTNISYQEARGLESQGLRSDPLQFYDFLLHCFDPSSASQMLVRRNLAWFEPEAELRHRGFPDHHRLRAM